MTSRIRYYTVGGNKLEAEYADDEYAKKIYNTVLNAWKDGQNSIVNSVSVESGNIWFGLEYKKIASIELIKVAAQT